MNFRIDAIEILLNEDCILSRYYPLIPLKHTLLANLRNAGIETKAQCQTLSDEALAALGLSDPALIALFRRFLVMYDVNPQKLREIPKISRNADEQAAFSELYLLPGVKETRARLYFDAGYRRLAAFADANPEQLLRDAAETIRRQQSDAACPLPKEARTHIAVAKVYTFFL